MRATATLLVLVVVLALAGCQSGGDGIPRPDLGGVEPEIAEEIRRLQQELRDATDDAERWGSLGDRYLAHGWRFEASVCYAQAEQLDPTSFDWAYLHGHALTLRDLEGARDAFARAVAIDGGYAPARIRYAESLHQLGESEAARAQYDALLQLDSLHVEALRGAARIDLDAQRFAEAEALLLRAIEADGGVAETHHLLSQLYLLMGDTDGARTQSAIANERPPARALDDPRRRRALPQSGSLARSLDAKDLEEQGRWSEALAEYRAAAVNAPDDAVHPFNVARMLLRLRQTDDAVDALNTTLSIDAKHVGALALLGEIHERRGEMPRALQLFTEALAIEPDSARILFRQGSLLVRGGQLEPGVAALQRSLELAPENVRARVNLGIALAQSGRFDAAEPQLREAVRLDPADSEALYNLGLLLASSERFEEAERLLADAARIAPNDPSIGQLLDRVRRRLEGPR